MCRVIQVPISAAKDIYEAYIFSKVMTGRNQQLTKLVSKKRKEKRKNLLQVRRVWILRLWSFLHLHECRFKQELAIRTMIQNVNECRSYAQNSTSIFRQIRGPQSKVVSQQLHDKGAVFVWFLTQSIQLCNCLIKCLFSQMAGPGSFD